MRKLIAAMKISLDGKVVSDEGDADWVEAWSEDYGLTPQIDACLLGGNMYPGYESYWTAVQAAPAELHPMTGRLPTADEIKWAKNILETPHYVLSNTQTTAHWPGTRFLRSTEDVRSLMRQPGKDIYLVGGAETVSSLIEAGLVHEVRLIVHPLLVHGGISLFATIENGHALELAKAQELKDGRVSLNYRFIETPK